MLWRNPEEATAFTDAMTILTTGLAAEVALVLDTGGLTRVVDVGGAAGALLFAIAPKSTTIW